MPLSYWASISCHTRPTFQVFTQDAGTASEQEARQGGPLLASSLRPPATCVNAYLVPCPPCGDFVGIRSYKQVRKETKTTTTMEKKPCIEWGKCLRGAEFAVRIPDIAFDFPFVVYHTSGERYADAERSNCL